MKARAALIKFLATGTTPKALKSKLNELYAEERIETFRILMSLVIL